MKTVTIEVTAMDPEQYGCGIDCAMVTMTEQLSADSIVLDPAEDCDKSSPILGVTFKELLEEFHDEFGVTIDCGGSDTSHEFNITDHDFTSRVETEECVENLLCRVVEWVKGA